MKLLRLALGIGIAFPAVAHLRANPVAPIPAPAWRLKDLAGNVVSSDQMKGKVVVVDFWATWCMPCRSEIPGYVALQKKYAKDGLVIVGISVDQDQLGHPAADIVRKFVDKFGVSYTILMADDAVAAAFDPNMDGIPTTFVIDRDGIIREKKIGAEPAAEFEKKILKYLAPAESKT